MGYEDRQNKVFSLGVILTSYISLNFFYSIRIKGARNIPKQGPVLLLVKHHEFIDAPLESFIIYQQTKRMSYYVMKDGLPAWLEYLGGIISPRIMDMPEDREKKREWIKYAQNLKKKLINFLTSKFKKGALVTIHPEMTRNKGFVGEIKAAIVKDIINYALKLNLRLAVIPVGVNYAAPKKFRSRVEVNIGRALSNEQKQDTKKLYPIIREQLSKLSNLDKRPSSS